MLLATWIVHEAMYPQMFTVDILIFFYMKYIIVKIYSYFPQRVYLEVV